MHCDNCNSDESRHLRIRMVTPRDKDNAAIGEPYKVESCDLCANLPSAPPSFRDAIGGKVTWPTGLSKFSYATGTPITSAREMSEQCKKNNLVQKGQA